MTATLLTSCSRGDSRPISDSLLVEVLADLHLAEALSAVDEAEEPARDSVLAAHEVTQEELRRTLEWYAERPNEYLSVYDRVLSQLNQQYDHVYERRRAAGRDTSEAAE